MHRALDQMWARVRELEHEVATYRERAELLEHDVGAAQTELAEYRSREEAIADGEELARRLVAARLAEADVAVQERDDAARTRADEILADADRRAQEIVAAATADAAQRAADAERDGAAIRAAATIDAELRLGEANRELAALLRLKDDLLRDVRYVLDELDQVTTRFERGETSPLAGVTPLPVEVLATADDTPSDGPAALAVAVPGDHLFNRHAVLDVGPIEDFAQLGDVEHALAKIPSVTDVYVRRFASGRATIEVTLSRPSALLRALAQALPYSFDVDALDGDTLTLNIAAPLAAAR